jgi:outer membrane protein assembly factor BamB
MRTLLLVILAAITTLLCPRGQATQADDTTITIDGQTPGVTPFVAQLTLTASDTTVLKSIQFTVTPKPGSVTRPLSGTYSIDYMIRRGFLVPPSNQIFLPVYGLYDNFTNNVTLTYLFLDGSSKGDSTAIATADFVDPECSYESPTVLQARTSDTTLSYDYMMVRGACGDFSPVVLDTDSNLRWSNPMGTSTALLASSGFFDNAVFFTQGTSLFRVELDGAITTIASYDDLGIVNFHHNIDEGKVGMILEADTTTQFESFLLEVDLTGKVIKTWDLAQIISDTMVAGGDDPSQFVFPTPTDWFHNNAATYNHADDSVIVSSRENFVIAIDYETGAVKWILGDPTKHWHEFPSLAQFALDVAPDSLPPIGEHATSIAFDQGLLLFDNGANSSFQMPPGVLRDYASPRKYSLALDTNTATEVWNFEMGQSINSPFCGSVYEDAPLNYLVDYAIVGGFTTMNPTAQLLGLDAGGKTIFYYEYPTTGCDTAYNSVPVHWEKTRFPSVTARALNLSTRGMIAPGDDALIAGFIITGTESKKLALRVLGPSLSDAGLAGTLSDPTLSLFDSSGALVASNDDWESDPGAAEITAIGLAPGSAAESAIIPTLSPGAYTLVASGKGTDSGIGLVEMYDLSSLSDSSMANISARGLVGAGDQVLISGFILGDVSNATVVIRALGPSLATFGVDSPVTDPSFTVFDENGMAIAANDNWQDSITRGDVQINGLAPSDPVEAATVLHPPAGSYSVIVSGAGGETGIGLLEIYDLD